MKFIKDKEERRRDYIFQKDRLTKNTAKFVAVTLIVLVCAVAVSGIYFEI
ncbi:hypothetical protein [Winogradskyella jejuensis]|uniref:Uncharacterized protein n=1 Tax=Winogradskyella jejuensis TaxID=1089305 RepID=A0A1M5JP15_9FLAO|nr:hypothetical protein [Winogradskyella jejuensis]SHG42271.1 hypothetical protein SAMN05444148_0099 [Winogradskyella jejuensis]